VVIAMIAAEWPGCSEADADETTRTHTTVNLSTLQDPGARGAHRTRPARASEVTTLKALQAASESDLHKSVADLLDWVLVPPAFFTTFPAGWGKLTRRTAGRLNGAGLKPGMPDIFVFPGQGRIVGLELKAYGRGTSDVQDTMHAKLKAAGIPVHVCKSIADVIAALAKERVPFKYVREGDMNAPRTVGLTEKFNAPDALPRRGARRRRSPGPTGPVA
jgi:hypothetical protein